MGAVQGRWVLKGGLAALSLRGQNRDCNQPNSSKVNFAPCVPSPPPRSYLLSVLPVLLPPTLYQTVSSIGSEEHK